MVGSKITDTFYVLRSDWFGTFSGLYIDSYKKIKHIDGYKIILKNIEKEKLKNTKFLNEKNPKNKLWFVNIGGYKPRSM